MYLVGNSKVSTNWSLGGVVSQIIYVDIYTCVRAVCPGGRNLALSQTQKRWVVRVAETEKSCSYQRTLVLARRCIWRLL